MGKLVISLDGVIIKEVPITKEKTTLGLRPYNDIVIDNLAISGEHASLQRIGADIFIEDLNSTNGTYLNGKFIKRQLLAHNDVIEVGKYKIKYVLEANANFERTMIIRSPSKDALAPAAPLMPTSGPGSAPSSRFSATSSINPSSHFSALQTL